MKNTKLSLRLALCLLAVVAAVSLFAGCDTGSSSSAPVYTSPLAGSWEYSETDTGVTWGYRYEFTDTDYTRYMIYNTNTYADAKGTYTYTDTNLTLTQTQSMSLSTGKLVDLATPSIKTYAYSIADGKLTFNNSTYTKK